MMFLPYHSLGITWWHQFLVLIDLILVIVMWRRFFYDGGIKGRQLPVPGLRLRWLSPVSYACLFAVVFWLSLWEGRWADEPLIGRRDLRATESGVVFGLFPDRLQLRGEPIVGKEEFEKTKEEMASRGGSFVPTIRLDFRDLQAARLAGADLRGVSLVDAVMRDANLEFARFNHGNLSRVQLQRADLWGAQLLGADLQEAQLQGAHLNRARLQGAELDGAQLQGAELAGVKLRGADLRGAQLQGASFFIEWLPLRKLMGLPDLQGADLGGAQLQGADLRTTQMAGADLSDVELLGADVSTSDLRDSEFEGAFVFRTNLGDGDPLVTAIGSLHTDAVKMDEEKIEPLGSPDMNAWIAAATQFADEADKAQIEARFGRLKSDFQTDDQDGHDQETWKNLVASNNAEDPAGDQHRLRLATILGDLACDPDDAPYVALGLIRATRLEDAARLAALGDQLDTVRERMNEGRKEPEKCPGVSGFTDDDWRRLDAIKATQVVAPSATPKQP